MKTIKNKSLQNLNTFGIEATAKEYTSISSTEEAIGFFKNRPKTLEDLLILGGGSNILLTKNFEGLVIQNNILGIEIIDDSTDTIELRVGAGENWHDFVLHCIASQYCGLENLSLIPGCVGASPMQNIGAYGVEVKDHITKVETIAIENGDTRLFENQECKFDYRSSIFKTSHKNKYFISHVYFKLSKKANLKVSYGAIREELLQLNKAENEWTIKDVSDAVIKIRKSKLPDPKEIGNSGSFFKNPVVSNTLFENLKQKFEDIAAYPLENGQVKIAAGWLIEKAGWKGYRKKDFGVHQKQALVLVNYGKASGKEIFDLSQAIIDDISAKFGIELEREVNIY